MLSKILPEVVNKFLYFSLSIINFWNSRRINKNFIPPSLRIDGKFRGHHPIFFSSAKFEVADSLSDSVIPPPLNEEYFEWIDVLMSIKDAKDSYFVVELGAGYGRWGVRAGLAALSAGINSNKVKMVFVEAEPKHVDLIYAHLKNNNFHREQFSIIEGAISDRNGTAEFITGMPGDDFESTYQKWWGQAIAKDYEEIVEKTHHSYHNNHTINIMKSGCKSTTVALIDALDLASNWEVVDLLDMDVQGQELVIVKRLGEFIKQSVKRLHIGTHSREIELELKSFLLKSGMVCVRDYPCNSCSSTPFGKIHFVDGVQSWINPAFSEITYG